MAWRLGAEVIEVRGRPAVGLDLGALGSTPPVDIAAVAWVEGDQAIVVTGLGRSIADLAALAETLEQPTPQQWAELKG